MHSHMNGSRTHQHQCYSNRALICIVYSLITCGCEIKQKYRQGIESDPLPDRVPWMYKILDGPYTLGSWVRGGPYSLREYGPPDRILPRTVMPMTPAKD